MVARLLKYHGIHSVAHALPLPRLHPLDIALSIPQHGMEAAVAHKLVGNGFGAFRSGVRRAMPLHDVLCHYPHAPCNGGVTSRGREIPIFLSSLNPYRS
jgi:hypothetical protein